VRSNLDRRLRGGKHAAPTLRGDPDSRRISARLIMVARAAAQDAAESNIGQDSRAHPLRHRKARPKSLRNRKRRSPSTTLTVSGSALSERASTSTLRKRSANSADNCQYSWR